MKIEEPLKGILLFILYIISWVLWIFNIQLGEVPLFSFGIIYVYWWTYQWAKRNRHRNIWIYRLYYFMKWAFIFTIAYLFYGYFKEKIFDED